MKNKQIRFLIDNIATELEEESPDTLWIVYMLKEKLGLFKHKPFIPASNTLKQSVNCS